MFTYCLLVYHVYLQEQRYTQSYQRARGYRFFLGKTTAAAKAAPPGSTGVCGILAPTKVRLYTTALPGSSSILWYFVLIEVMLYVSNTKHGGVKENNRAD